jgi:hypothetical protein
VLGKRRKRDILIEEVIVQRFQEMILKDRSLFQSFFMGGFKCSSHRLRSGKRLDLLASTQYNRYVLADIDPVINVEANIKWKTGVVIKNLETSIETV